MTLESSSYLPPGLPVPRPTRDGVDAGYWDATKRHELAVQRCGGCGAWQWEPEWLCRRCGASPPQWQAVSGRGRIFSWARVWHPVHPALSEACPYIVVVVELPHAGNVRMVGNLLGDPHQNVVIGAPVEAIFEDHPEGEFTLVQWRMTGEAT
jgi:uncharacterized OB-fold protein